MPRPSSTVPCVSADGRVVLALEEARTALAMQRSDLDAVRDRAATLLGFAGAAAAFIGGLALRGDVAPVRGWTIAGAVAFAVVALVALFVQAPRTWIFANDARTMLDEWRLLERTETEVVTHLADYLVSHAEENAPKVLLLQRAYVAGMVAFVVELVCLFLDLVGR